MNITHIFILSFDVDNGIVPVVSTLCLNMERFLEFIDRNDT